MEDVEDGKEGTEYGDEAESNEQNISGPNKDSNMENARELLDEIDKDLEDEHKVKK